MAVLSHTTKSVPATSILGLAAKTDRQYLLIQNKHASQTVRVKFGAAHIADTTEIQTVTFTDAASGNFRLNWNGGVTADIAFDAIAATVQTALRTITGLSSVTVAGIAGAYTVTMTSGVYPDGDLPLMTVSNNTMVTAGAVAVPVTVAETTQGKYADGLVLAAGATLQFNPAPDDAVYLLASGADTRVDLVEG